MTTEADIQLLQLAVYRNSLLIYDNLGISVSMSEMPSAPAKQEVCRALYPRGRLARFLLRIQPKKKRGLQVAYNFLSERVKQERSNYLLDKAMELMKDAE